MSPGATWYRVAVFMILLHNRTIYGSHLMAPVGGSWPPCYHSFRVYYPPPPPGFLHPLLYSYVIMSHSSHGRLLHALDVLSLGATYAAYFLQLSVRRIESRRATRPWSLKQGLDRHHSSSHGIPSVCSTSLILPFPSDLSVRLNLLWGLPGLV